MQRPDNVCTPEGGGGPFGPTAGVLMLDAADHSARWCNDFFRKMIREPYRTQGVEGVAFSDLAPLWSLRLGPILDQVAGTGTALHGNDAEFDLANGSVTWRWSVERPEPGLLLAVVDVVAID